MVRLTGQPRLLRRLALASVCSTCVAASLCRPHPEGARQRIFLTSDGPSSPEACTALKDALQAAGAGPGSPARVVTILDAKNDPDYTTMQRKQKIDAEKADLIACSPGGISFVDLWMSDDEFNEAAATEAISNCTMLWIMAGDSYYLTATLRRRRPWWDKAVLPSIQSGQFLLGARGAGAIVMGKDMGIALEPRAPSGAWWSLGGQYDGLGIVPCILFVHYYAGFDRSLADYRSGEMSRGPCPSCAILLIPDGAALQWHGGGADVQYVMPAGKEAPDSLLGSLPNTRCTALVLSVGGFFTLLLCAVAGHYYWYLRRRSHLLECPLQLADRGEAAAAAAS